MQFYEVKYSDALGVFASVTHDSENRPVASTDRAGRVTRTEYWPTGQVKRRISPDGNFIGYEYDIEGRMTKVWESVPEQNSAQAAGPFGGSKDIALTKTIEYYYGLKNDGTNGQNLSWTGTQLNAGTYIAGVRTYTYKGAGPVYYDMVYTSNAHGQPEMTLFIDSDDSTTRSSTKLYNWRGKVRRMVNPDTNYLDYTWDDHLRMTAEKLDGDDEKYEYEYCLCSAIKRHKYTYEDSLSNSQTETWTETTDDLGRKVKEYYPYTIAVNDSDEYHSILYEFDTASRRKMYSDPTYGHTCADTSGWTDDTEPFDEENWISNEPQRYLYGKAGGLEATGRAASSEIMAGQGEPYFVQRDGAGRIAKVVYPDDDTTEVPQIEWQYTYGGDGRVKQVAAVKTTDADDTTYGPQKYVVQFFHDDVGRLIRKVVRDNAKQDTIDTRYETKYEYDGRGQLTREQIIRYIESDDKMQVMSDIQTTYDLGRNPITIKVYDNSGWAYTETRTYAKGYQLTGFSTSAAAGVTINTHGSYTYDTNNNLTTTKKLDASRSGNQLAYRAEWTFTYDRKNRLKSHTNTNASNVRGNLWYDSRGRVWQRWQDNSVSGDWDQTLTRFVYDGSTLVQEHNFDVAEVLNAWVYTYDDLTRDYLRQPGGMRQRERVSSIDTDYYLQANQGTLEYKIERSPVSETYARTERKSSLDQLPTSTFSNISNLATPNGYIEMYGGSTSGSTAGFDALVHMSGRHYLAGLGRFTNRMGNNAYIGASYARSLTQIVDNSPSRINNMDFTIGEHCAYCRCDNHITGALIGWRCWRSLPDSEDGWNCFCQEMSYSCSDPECSGGGNVAGGPPGIQCGEDVGASGLNYDINNWVDAPDFDFGGTRLCTNNELDMMGLIIYIAVIAQGCIKDAALAECVMKAVYDVGIGPFGPKIWCDCDKLDDYTWGFTNCERGICIDLDRIEKDFPDLNLNNASAAILLHELVHWCMNCKFKRPWDQQIAAAETCHHWCFGDVKLSKNPNLLYGYHGITVDWRNRNNCSICGDDYYFSMADIMSEYPLNPQDLPINWGGNGPWWRD
jgi:YD repeat-containing protein